MEERRQAPGWEPGKPRERRRPRWGEFREAYPRIVAATAIGIVALLALDAFVLFKRVTYNREIRRLRGEMTEVERKRTDTLVEAAEKRLEMMVELARRQAIGDPKLNLSVSVEEGAMYLQREGAQLREMRVRVGPEETVGTPPAAVRLAPPRGKRAVLRVVDGSYRWQVPAWVYAHRGVPVPGDRVLKGALGPLAIILDGGTVIYSRPGVGPLDDDSYVMPGSVRAEAGDLEAILENLEPGMPIYFY